jgi:hypothetical protein
VTVNTKSEALSPFVATTLLFKGHTLQSDLMLRIMDPFHPGMIVMVGKAFVHFDAMVVEQLFVTAYISIFCCIITKSFPLLTRFRGQFGW